MANVKVCIWNIQNYGSGAPWRKHGTSSAARNRFIAKFALLHGIDVLLVQEVSRNAYPSLVNLARALNGGRSTSPGFDWVFSYCGSALARDADNPPTSADQLTFRTDARAEGYAVLWRQSRPSFDLLPALHDIALQTWPAGGSYPATSPLNLSVTGRPAEGARLAEFAVTGGYTADGAYPFERDTRMDHWPTLVMPSTSSLNPVGLQWARARRPATVLLRFTGNGQLVPVSAYHAPSNQAAAAWGAQLSALARELYVANQYNAVTRRPIADQFVYAAKTVMGGDYNYSVAQAEWAASDYQGYGADFAAAPAGGAQCTERPAHDAAQQDDRKTTVRLLQGHAGSEPVAGDDVNDYLTLKIDLAFYRTGSGITAERVNVVDELVNQTRERSYRLALRQYMIHLNAVIATYRRQDPSPLVMDAQTGPRLTVWDKKRRVWRHDRTVPLFAGNWGGTFVDWDAFKTKLTSGHLDAARQAAEFYQIFISDHLPLVATIPDA